MLLLKRYQREVKDLKAELRMHDQIARRAQATYDPLSAEQQYELQMVAKSFLDGEREEIEEITSMRQVRELLA